jgi:phosphate transport system substrate-binding protein
VTDRGNLARYPGRNARIATLPRWVWIVAAALVAGTGTFYAAWRGVTSNRAASDVILVCPIPSAQRLAADLVRGYAAKTGTSASRFDLTQARVCDVRFVLAPQAPDAIIASDDIVAIVNPFNTISRVSEKQLREIFSGSVRDWAQLGNPRGPIVPILPDTDSDEAKVLASSLLYGVAIDRGVQRVGVSADVASIVTGADRTGRSAIGLVAFSRRIGAKVIPIVASAASSHFGHRLTIGIEPAAGRGVPADGFIDYARSAEGAAIVRKNGFIPPNRG